MSEPHERHFYEVWADESKPRLIRVVAAFQPYTLKMQLEDFGHAIASVHMTFISKSLSVTEAREYDKKCLEANQN